MRDKGGGAGGVEEEEENKQPTWCIVSPLTTRPWLWSSLSSSTPDGTIRSLIISL